MSTNHHNPITGRAFKSNEVAPLDRLMRDPRFKRTEWATAQQWKEKGTPVAKGEKGARVVASSGFAWVVFNVAQTSGSKAAAEAPRAVRIVVPPAKMPAHKHPAARAAKSKTVSKRGAAAAAPAVTVAAQPLREALEWTRRAVSTEETRYYLCGVYFAPINDTSLQIVATDGHRMHVETLPCTWRGARAGFILPTPAVREVVNALRGANKASQGSVSITVDGSKIVAKISDGATIKATAIDGTFPDYQRIVPSDRRAPVKVDTTLAFNVARDAIAFAKAGERGKGRNKTKPTAQVGLNAAGAHGFANTYSEPGALVRAEYLVDVTWISDTTVDMALAKTRPEGSPLYFAAGQRFAVLMPMRGTLPDRPSTEAPADEPAAQAQPVDTVDQSQPVETATAEPEAPPSNVVPMSWRERWARKFRPNA